MIQVSPDRCPRLTVLKEDKGPEIELVVLRNLANHEEFSEELYGFLKSVVNTACAERRNVRVRSHNIC